MVYYTHCSIIDAPQFVQVDEPSEFPDACTFYNTLHRDMDAPQCVKADVPSGCAMECSITHITAIWTLLSMYNQTCL
jgi:hypothetical protein